MLGSTLERVKLPDDLVARLEGKSSLGRLGLLIHSTAGFIDPGWDGHVTLELSNVANLPITIYFGMKIGQLSFVQLTEPAEKPYGSGGLGSKYQGQKGRRRAATGRTSSSEGPRHRRDGVRRPSDRPGARRRRAHRAGTGAEAWSEHRSSSQEALQGDMTDLRASGRLPRARRSSCISSRSSTGPPEEFQRVMEQGTRDLVAAAPEAGVRRFVLMSALGVDEQTKELVPYYHAKWEMEQTVRDSGMEYVIFRPSFIFGPGGGALQQFARIAKLAPVTPIVGPGTQRLQPIWIEDLAAYFAAGVDKPEAAGRTFELGGPDIVTWNEFWELLKNTLGIGVPRCTCRSA